MPIVVSEGSNVAPLAEEQYPAVCVHVIDIGTQPPAPNSKFQKWTRKVVLVWELPGEQVEFEKDGELVSFNRTVSKTFTLSLHENGHLRPFLVAWRGRKFTAEELQRFELDQLLGVPCMVQIVHAERNGRTYANAENVFRLPKGMQKPEATKPLISFSLNDVKGDSVTWPLEMPSWTKEKIMQSKEWLERFDGGMGNDDIPPPTDQDASFLEDEDSLPF